MDQKLGLGPGIGNPPTQEAKLDSTTRETAGEAGELDC